MPRFPLFWTSVLFAAISAVMKAGLDPYGWLVLLVGGAAFGVLVEAFSRMKRAADARGFKAPWWLPWAIAIAVPALIFAAWTGFDDRQAAVNGALLGLALAVITEAASSANRWHHRRRLLRNFGDMPR